VSYSLLATGFCHARAACAVQRFQEGLDAPQIFRSPILRSFLEGRMSASMAMRIGDSAGRGVAWEALPASERARPASSPSKRSKQFVPTSLSSDRSFTSSRTTSCLNSWREGPLLPYLSFRYGLCSDYFRRFLESCPRWHLVLPAGLVLGTYSCRSHAFLPIVRKSIPAHIRGIV